MACDPFATGNGCRDNFIVVGNYTDYRYDSVATYYKNGNCKRQQTGRTTATSIKNWYGTGTTFDVQTRWPEIVYCNSASAYR